MQGGPEAGMGGPRRQVHATWDVSKARCDGGDVNPRRRKGGQIRSPWASLDSLDGCQRISEEE